MNGVSWTSQDGNPMTSAEATTFAEQLNRLFAGQQSLQVAVRSRTRERARRLSLFGHAVLAREYREACHQAGFSSDVGFGEFVASLADGVDSETGPALWRRALEQQ